MTTECDDLRNELRRLGQQISNLDNRFIPLSEKPAIYRAIGKAQGTADTNTSKILDLVIELAKLLATIIAVKSVADGAATKAGKALSLLGAIQAGLEFVLGELRQFVIRERFNALENRVNVVEGNLDVLTRVVQFLKRAIDANARAIEAVKQSLNTLYALFYSLRNQVATLDSKVFSLEQRVSLLENYLETIKKQIRSLFVRVNTLEDLVAEIQAWRQTVDTRLRSLFVRVNTLEDTLKEIRVRLLAAERKINGLLAAVATLTATVGALGVALAALTAVVKALGIALAKLTAQVVALRAALFALGRQVAILTAKLEVVNRLAQFAARQAAIARLKAAEALALARSAMAKAVSALAKAISAFRLAQQALSRANAAFSRAEEAIRRIAKLEIRVDVLEKIIVEIKAALADIKALLSGEASGQIDLSPCNADEESALSLSYSGSGLSGLYSGLNALAATVETIHSNTRCESDGNAVLPMFWEVKAAEVPQLVVIWKINEAGKYSRWSMTIPHPDPALSPSSNISLPPYIKGNLLCTTTFGDNTKLIINALNKVEADKVLNGALLLMHPDIRNNGNFRTTYSELGTSYEEVPVVASYIKKFDGHKNTAPLWAVSLSNS